MTVRFARAVGATLTARLASAFLSFVIFAGVAASLTPASAARVLFFSFAFGFAVSSLRTFHLLASGVTGHERRSERLRRVRAAARTLSRLTLVLAPVVLLLLLSQGLGLPAALAATMLVAAGSHDLDLPRAVVGRTPILPWLTAAGGVVGLIWLSWMPHATEEVAVAALLSPWCTVAAYRLLAGRRLLGSTAIGVKAGVPQARRLTAGSLLLSIYDGAILNAPFILALPLSSHSAVDLALGNRLYVASLALYSLVSSWAVSGDVHRWSLRTSFGAPMLFAGAQLAAALPIGLLYAGAYALISGDRVSGMSLITFLVQLGSFTLFITTVRFGDFAARGYAAAVFGMGLATFYAACTATRWALPPGTLNVPEVLGAVAAALVLPAMIVIGLRRLRRIR
jgi:hypothetical protein